MNLRRPHDRDETVTLLFGVHAHQPVGNFPEVIAEAHLRCYRPFLQTLHRHPQFRFSVHFSGWLLAELTRRYPEDMALLGEMVARGQTELFGGGDCEPVLAAIPARDRSGQIAALSERLHRQFGQRPRGAWLTERVWEATVVPELADNGIDYVTVDDYHFLCTGLGKTELDGYYTTEENGRSLDLFPISEALRYRLPFSPAPEAIAHLEELALCGQQAAVYFDDIEKFGIWPETYEWVYERGWLEQFIVGILASPLIRTATYADYHGANKTRGIVYLPTTSYSEMNEWTLPNAAAETYAALLSREKASGQIEAHRPFIRGGIWRNFFSRYPESNWMHKRMLALSTRLAGIPAAASDATLRQYLYRAQANDAYWHGLFGGLYLPHLRRTVYNQLLQLEAALDSLGPRPALARSDLDHDGHDELFLRGPDVQAVIREDGLASVIELDAYPMRHNFGDTLRRSREHYHGKLNQAQATAAEANAPAEGISSAHERVAFKHLITADDMLPDDAPRAMFIDHSVDGDGRRTLIDRYQAYGDGAFSYAAEGWQVNKIFALAAQRIIASYCFLGTTPAVFECEINLAMPSCDSFSGRYILADGSIPCGYGQPLEIAAMSEVTLDDRELKGRVVVRASRPLTLSAAPLHTVSQSEAGFEKIMQAACLRLSWTPLPGEEQNISLELIADGA